MILKLNKKIASLAVGGMLLAGSVSGIAFADSSTQGTAADQPKDKYFQEFIGDFAKNLGVSQDQVTAALEATKKQIIQEQVTAGKLTQAQADKILAQKGVGFGFRMGGHKGFGEHREITQDSNFLNSASSALKITADQLKSELQAGKKLSQIVTDHGMTMDQFREKMPKPQKLRINKDQSSSSSTTTVTTN